jgi:hypothetical protein
MIIGAFAFGFSLALSKSMSAPGPKTEVKAHRGDVGYSPNSGHCST